MFKDENKQFYKAKQNQNKKKGIEYSSNTIEDCLYEEKMKKVLQAEDLEKSTKKVCVDEKIYVNAMEIKRTKKAIRKIDF